MTETIYTVDTGRVVYETTSADTAEVAARMGQRVTARVQG